MRCGVIGVEMAICRRDHQFAAARHRVARVGGKVGKAGLELRRIDHHRPDLFGEIERGLDVLAEQAAQQLDHAADQLIEVDALGLQRLAPREREQPARQIGAPHRCVDCFARQIVDLRVVLPGFQQDVEIADDDAKQIVEIMRHAAGEIADRLHLLRLDQSRLGLLAFGHLGFQRLVGVLQLQCPRLHRCLQRGGIVGHPPCGAGQPAV